MAVQARANLEAYVGMTGSGKGVSIARRLAELKPARLLVWDPRDEYGDQAARFDSLPLLVQAFKKAGPRPIRARFVHGGRGKIADAFGIVCEVAFQAGHMVLLAEELSDVTQPSWAPERWRKCITQGRHRGLHLIGATQRPALIDKTFMGNCTRVRCFALGYADDQVAMARELNCPPDVVQALATEEQGDGSTVIRYMERERRPPRLFAGVIRLKGSTFDERRSEVAQRQAGPSPFDALVPAAPRTRKRRSDATRPPGAT